MPASSALSRATARVRASRWHSGHAGSSRRALNTPLNLPEGLVYGKQGRVYISDTFNNALVELCPLLMPLPLYLLSGSKPALCSELATSHL